MISPNYVFVFNYFIIIYLLFTIDRLFNELDHILTHLKTDKHFVMLSDNRDFILTFIQIRNSLRKHTYLYIYIYTFS